jgi:hypothetical protein
MSDELKAEVVKPKTDFGEKKQMEPIKMAPEKPVYNPALKYSWPKDAKFELTGDQFGLWLNSVRGKVTSTEAMEYRLAFESSDVIEGIMKAGVEAGIIVELAEEAK